MNRGIIISAYAAAFACRAPAELELIAPAMPADLAFVAALPLGAGGRPLAGSGLATVEAGKPSYAVLDRVDRSAPFLVVGYTSEQLRHLDLPDADALFAARLTGVTDAQAPVLPIPAWAERLDPDTGTHEALTDKSFIELSASWLPPCPTRTSSGSSVDLSCVVSACGAKIVESACRIEIDTGPCVLGTLEASVDGRGKVAFDPSPELGSCTMAAGREGATVSVACSGGSVRSACRLDVIPARAPEIEAMTRRVLDGAPDATNPFEMPYHHQRPVGGYLFGLAITRDAVVAGARPGAFQPWEVCDDLRPSSLLFLDPETLAVVRTATAPPCVTDVIADPIGPGVLATFSTPWSDVGLPLARFDERGRMTRFRRLEGPAFPMHPRHRIPGLLAIDGIDRLHVLVSSPHFQEDGAFVLAVDPTTFEILHRVGPYGGHVRAAGRGPPGLIAVSDNESRREVLHLLDARTLAPQNPGEASLRALCSDGAGVATSAVEYHAATETLVVAATDNDAPSMFVVQPPLLAGACTPATFYEYESEPYSIAEWPADPGLVLVGLGESAAERAGSVALFDPRDVRFLPGALKVGFGPVTELTPDAKGRVFGLLPWSATVVRVSSIPRETPR